MILLQDSILSIPAFSTMTSPEFQDWCIRQGIQLNGIKAGFVADGWRGVIATQNLEPDTVVLEVPEPLLLSRRSAERDKSLGPLLRQHGHLNSYQVLAIHLLHEISKVKQPAPAQPATALSSSASSSSSPAPTSTQQTACRYQNTCHASAPCPCPCSNPNPTIPKCPIATQQQVAP